MLFISHSAFIIIISQFLQVLLFALKAIEFLLDIMGRLYIMNLQIRNLNDFFFNYQINLDKLNKIINVELGRVFIVSGKYFFIFFFFLNMIYIEFLISRYLTKRNLIIYN